MKYLILFFVTSIFLVSCKNISWEPSKHNNLSNENLSKFLEDNSNGSINSMLDKRYLVINFTEYYCKPCFEEIPDLNNLYDEYNNEEVGFVSFYTKDSAKLYNNIAKVGGFKFNLIKVNSDETRKELCRLYSEQQDLILDKCTLPSTFLVDLEKDSIMFRQLGKFEEMNDIKTLLAKTIH